MVTLQKNRPMKRLLTYMAIFATIVANAQSKADEIELLKQRLDALESEQTKAKERSFYMPQVCGSIMAYFNVNTYNGDQRFAVRNAQVGIKGNASNNISYYIQVNFHNLGSVTVLDSYMRYINDGFNITLGQQLIHITSDFDRCGQKSNLFTTRSYGVVFIPMYSDGSSIWSFGNRDIGLYANYTFSTEIPITLSLGAFNGAGLNKIEWDNDINLTGRIQIGGNSGLSGGGSIYYGNTGLNQKSSIYSGEIRYIKENLFIEANYQQKVVDLGETNQVTKAGLIEGYYTFKTPKSRLLDSYAPTLRYDFGDGMLYKNLDSGNVEEQDAGRISTLINFTLKGSKVRSRFSVGYEKVLMDEKPSDIAENPLFCDRFTMAMTVAF